jgi:hypothetical protein
MNSDDDEFNVRLGASAMVAVARALSTRCCALPEGPVMKVGSSQEGGRPGRATRRSGEDAPHSVVAGPLPVIAASS